jgi:fatty acid desaturase
MWLALKALAHPENDREWRMAWMWFVYPVFFIGGSGVLVSILLWRLSMPWWVIGLWLYYIWVCEPIAYLITPRENAEKQARWIEYGGNDVW